MEEFIWVGNKSYIFVLDSRVELPAILVIDIYDKNGSHINALTIYGEEEGINFHDTINALYDRLGKEALKDLNSLCIFLMKFQKEPARLNDLLTESGLARVKQKDLEGLGINNI